MASGLASFEAIDANELVIVLGVISGDFVGTWARALALISIWWVADSRFATWEARIEEAFWIRPFSVNSLKTSSRSRSFDCSSRDFVRL